MGLELGSEVIRSVAARRIVSPWQSRIALLSKEARRIERYCHARRSSAPAASRLSGNRIYGWFDDPDQTEPSHEPPRDAPCLFCGLPVHADDVRTHGCYIKANMPPAAISTALTGLAQRKTDHTAMDGLVLDMIARNGD